MFNQKFMHSQKRISFFFELHQPYRLNISEQQPTDNFTRDLKNHLKGPSGENVNHTYGNLNIFNKIAQNCYIPATEAWLKILKTHPNLRLNLSISGTLIDQCLEFTEFGKKVLTNLKNLVDTGQVELLAETYYHSLSFLFSTDDFLRQVTKHRETMIDLFGFEPTSFRNTEMIYNNYLGSLVRQMGFRSSVLEDFEADFKNERKEKLFYAKNVALTDEDQALVENFRFSKPSEKLVVLMKSYLLVSYFFGMNQHSAQFLADKILKTDQDWIGIFTDFEIFGEHNQNIESKITDLVDLLMKNNCSFWTLDQITNTKGSEFSELSVPNYTSWTNSWHDLRSWRGNIFQEKAFAALIHSHSLAKQLYFTEDSKSEELLHLWRYLTTSDHFYYMSDLPGEDGEMHAIFNAYSSNEEAFLTYCRVLDIFNKKIHNKVMEARLKRAFAIPAYS
jgi:alpha-amylase